MDRAHKRSVDRCSGKDGPCDVRNCYAAGNCSSRQKGHMLREPNVAGPRRRWRKLHEPPARRFRSWIVWTSRPDGEACQVLQQQLAVVSP